MGGWGSSPMATAHKAKSILASFDVDDRVIVGWKRAIQECWLCKGRSEWLQGLVFALTSCPQISSLRIVADKTYAALEYTSANT